jgi:hypothetical protein
MALKLRRAEERVVIQYSTRAASFKRLLDGALRAARPGAPKQVRFNIDEFEMRHLLRQIEFHISVTSETFDPEREA